MSGFAEVLPYTNNKRVQKGVQARSNILRTTIGLIAQSGLRDISTAKNHYGILRFFMNVMTHNMIAPMYGKHEIKDVFHEIARSRL